MLSIYFVRHGETDYNLKGIVQGGGVDAPLNKKGFLQAGMLYKAYRDVPFSCIYCSTLQRSYQTIQPWLDEGKECVRTSALNELSWGVQEGKVPSESGKASYRQIVEYWQHGKHHEKIEGGESPLDGWNRAGAFFERLHEQHEGGKLLICSHGRQIRIILSTILGFGLSHMELFSSKNTGVSLIHMYRNGRAFAEKLNDVSHLKSS